MGTLPLTICEYCHGSFVPEGAGISTCTPCYFAGRAHEVVFPVLLRDLHAALKGISPRIQFTYVGRGDFALEVRGMGLYPVIVATIAEQLANGVWTTRPAVPDPGQPWAVALFRTVLEWPHSPERTQLPATDAEVVAFVARHVQDLNGWSRSTHCRVCGCDPCLGARCEELG